MKTLRGKITIIVSIVLISTMGLLTAYSIFNSNNNFVQPMYALLESDGDATISIKQSAVKIIPINKINSAPSSETTAEITYDAVSPSEMAAAVTYDAAKAQQIFGSTQLIFMALVVLVGVFATYHLLGRALNPLAVLTNTAAEIDEHKLSTQIEVPTVADEISALTKSFNSMLDRLNGSFELQKNFAQNAAHELKTPLTVIKSSLQVLALGGVPTMDDYRENAEIIAQSTDELIEIVEQLLALTEKSAAKKEEVSLKRIVEEAVTEHDTMAKEGGITVSDEALDAKLYSNYVLLRSAITNVISNSIKYNKVGGLVKITSINSGDFVELTITDTGIGISSESLENVFSPFFRADESRSKKITGNGLGLSITNAAMERIGGTVSIGSTPGAGTTTILKIPIY